jgi:peptidoglycan/LPS O-acetylase OafA/YrhL
VSYGLYLWHPLAILLDGHLWSVPFLVPYLGIEWVKKSIDFAMSCGAAAVSFYFWERPFLKLKRYFQPRVRQKAPAPAPQTP